MKWSKAETPPTDIRANMVLVERREEWQPEVLSAVDVFWASEVSTFYRCNADGSWSWTPMVDLFAPEAP